MQPYIVMERIPGKTLYARLDELPLAYEEARGIALKSSPKARPKKSFGHSSGEWNSVNHQVA